VSLPIHTFVLYKFLQRALTKRQRELEKNVSTNIIGYKNIFTIANVESFIFIHSTEHPMKKKRHHRPVHLTSILNLQQKIKDLQHKGDL